MFRKRRKQGKHVDIALGQKDVYLDLNRNWRLYFGNDVLHEFNQVDKASSNRKRDYDDINIPFLP